MKSLLVVMLLAAAATASYIDSETPEVLVTYEEIEGSSVTDVPTAVATRRDINIGNVVNSRLLSRTHHVRTGIPGHRHIQDITFRTQNGLRITAIRVIHYGNYQGASSGIRSGGIGGTVLTIRLQSLLHFGYQYRIEIYGR